MTHPTALPDPQLYAVLETASDRRPTGGVWDITLTETEAQEKLLRLQQRHSNWTSPFQGRVAAFVDPQELADLRARDSEHRDLVDRIRDLEKRLETAENDLGRALARRARPPRPLTATSATPTPPAKED